MLATSSPRVSQLPVTEYIDSVLCVNEVNDGVGQYGRQQSQGSHTGTVFHKGFEMPMHWCLPVAHKCSFGLAGAHYA